MREVGPRRSSTHDSDCWAWYASHSEFNGIRLQVEERDKHVCGSCGRDTLKLKYEWFDRLREYHADQVKGYSEEYRRMNHNNLHPCQLISVYRCNASAPQPPAGFPFEDRRWWEMDHIIPVIEGGGGCTVDGYRTLCISCHKAETAKLAARRAVARKQKPAP